MNANETRTQAIKATRAMIFAVRAARPEHRIAAAKCAERAFARAYARLEAFGDFAQAENVALAGDAAAAEVAYRFPR